MKTAELIRAARERTGLGQFDSDSFVEPLEMLVRGVNERTDYTEGGLETLSGEFVNHLSNRLRVADYLRQHPELSDASAFHTGDLITVDGGWMGSIF